MYFLIFSTHLLQAFSFLFWMRAYNSHLVDCCSEIRMQHNPYKIDLHDCFNKLMLAIDFCWLNPGDLLVWSFKVQVVSYWLLLAYLALLVTSFTFCLKKHSIHFISLGLPIVQAALTNDFNIMVKRRKMYPINILSLPKRHEFLFLEEE